MPIINKVEARSLHVRLVFGAMYTVLILGAISMVYPFLLMLSGSVKSEADSSTFTPYPKYLIDDTILFQKYAESKHDVSITNIEGTWWEMVPTYRAITPPAAGDAQNLEDFLQWRAQLDKYWRIGHSNGGVFFQLFPKNARLFRQHLYEQTAGDMDVFRQQMDLPLKTWSAVLPPVQPPFRYPFEEKGLIKAWNDFQKTCPVEDRIIDNVDGAFWRNYLVSRYSNDITGYNQAHGTQYKSYHEVFLAARAPAPGLQRQDWNEYVRRDLHLSYVRLDESLAGAWHNFLASKKYASIAELNKNYQANFQSFADVPFFNALPSQRFQQVDWEAFIRDVEACPAESIFIYGPRQSFEEFVARKRGVPVAQLGNLVLPLKAADWHDMKAHGGELRWEFFTRNYKHVFQYIGLHGRGIWNTFVFCALAILTSLLVNPLAAYALSRYNPPSTFKILMLCMAVMAFPGEVTMIPGFLLLKRFPLWPLVCGGGAFVLTLWALSMMIPKRSEIIRITLSLAMGIVVGVWLVPFLIGKPSISLLNTFAALVLPGMANGFSIFLLKGFFDSLPRELYESAEVDGAGEWTKFWNITMSLSTPILAVIALGAFTAAYGAFMMALIIIPDQRMWTLMVWIFQLQSQSHQSVVYASLVISAIPTFFVFVFAQNIIIRGIIVPTEK